MRQNERVNKAEWNNEEKTQHCIIFFVCFYLFIDNDIGN